MYMKKKIFYFIIALFLFAGCIRNNEKTNNISEDTINTSTDADSISDTKAEKPSWLGDYSGILPCEDCDGIKTLLTLNDDKTFFLKMEYLGKGEPVIDKGGFEWNDDHTIITIYLQDNQTQQYLVGDGTLTVLDSQGKVPDGELANDYVLKKQ